MKTFGQHLSEQPETSRLDKVAHITKLSSRRLKQLAQPYPVFQHLNLEDWMGYPPPKNSSDKTKKEIQHIISLGELRTQYEDDMIMSDLKIMKAFQVYLDEYGLEVNTLDRIKEYKEQSEPIILTLKRHYNRPRPIQLAKELGLQLDTFPLKTANTPSYPSGHATQGRLVAKLIADEVPLEHRKNILEIGDRIAQGRQIAGSHYPSDTEFGYRLADELYRMATSGMEPDLTLETLLYEVPDLIGGDEDKHAVELTGFIDDSIASMSGEVALDPRDKKHNGSKVGVQVILPAKERIKYATAARAVIKSDPDLTLHSVSGSRSTKDFAFEHEDLDKYVYVNTRPDGKRGGGATADPNELMTAALCTLTEFDKVNTVEEMDALIEKVKGIVPKKVEGYTSLELQAMDNDYGNLAQAVSAARVIIKKGYGGASKVYLTAKAWHDEVSGFKRTKYGMKDFNASDFIIKKGDTYIGISLKKKKSAKTVDPTIINNSLYALLRKSGVDGASAVADDLELAAGEFYILIVKAAAKLQWQDRNKKGRARKAITIDGDPYLNKSTMKELGRSPRFPGITTKNWKTFVQRIPNEFINNQLSTNTKSILKPMADAIVSEADIFADILLEIIIKTTLKELKSVNFEYALVTGVGRMLKSGLVVEKGSFLSVDVMATKLDELFKTGKPNMSLNTKKVQAFDKGATSAIVHFDLNIGTTKIADLQLRYKGNFQSAPSFQAQLSKEFKEALA
jgi:hypothetical protein